MLTYIGCHFADQTPEISCSDAECHLYTMEKSLLRGLEPRVGLRRGSVWLHRLVDDVFCLVETSLLKATEVLTHAVEVGKPFSTYGRILRIDETYSVVRTPT
jgi:hypothetical protein